MNGEWDYIGIYVLLYIYIYTYSIYTVSICLYGDNMGIYGLGLSEIDQWSTVIGCITTTMAIPLAPVSTSTASVRPPAVGLPSGNVTKSY